jgi:hypothetical protein
MEWITPKTDWYGARDSNGTYTGDRFNFGDYNRIKGNINYLHALAAQVYMPFGIEDMGDDKGVEDYPYADEINRLADNLETIRDWSYAIDIGVKTVYEDNGPFIGYADLNRIEKACLELYTNLNRIKAGKARLSFRLGAKREVF